jgi:hypothetical protein
MSGCFQALADFTSEEFGDISKHKVICGSQWETLYGQAAIILLIGSSGFGKNFSE